MDEYRELRHLVDTTSRSKQELEPVVRHVGRMVETIEAHDNAVGADALDALEDRHRILIERVHERVDEHARGRAARRELLDELL